MDKRAFTLFRMYTETALWIQILVMIAFLFDKTDLTMTVTILIVL